MVVFCIAHTQIFKHGFSDNHCSPLQHYIKCNNHILYTCIMSSKQTNSRINGLGSLYVCQNHFSSCQTRKGWSLFFMVFPFYKLPFYAELKSSFQFQCDFMSFHVTNTFSLYSEIQNIWRGLLDSRKDFKSAHSSVCLSHKGLE